MKTSKLSLIIALVLPLFLIGCEKEAPGPDSFNGVLKFALLYDYDFSEAVTVYGPLKVERAKSKPVALINEIQLSDYDCYEPVYLVEIASGASDDSNSASSAIIKINGEVILSQKDYNNKTLYYSSILELPETFTLEIKLIGQPEDFVTVEIKGIKICSECGGTFIDQRDGHEYKTVQIGDQCWMAENLAYLPSVSPPNEGSMSDPFYYVYGYYGTDIEEAKATDNYQTYGVLYNWPAALESSPAGWHLPSKEEWQELINFITNDAPANQYNIGYFLKAATGWPQSYPDTYSFGLLPSGSANGNDFSTLGIMAYTWSSTEVTSGGVAAYAPLATFRNETFMMLFPPSPNGIPVRCIKDE